MIPIDKQCNWIQYYYKKNPLRGEYYAFSRGVWWINHWQTVCGRQEKSSHAMMAEKKILLIQKEGLCSFYGHMSQRLYRTFLLKFVNSLSSLVCRCRPIQFLQARVLRSGELFGTRASCLLLGSWITIANREHFKLRYPSLLRSSKEQKCKYIIPVYIPSFRGVPFFM